MTDAPELLPCPFCGSAPIVSQPKTVNGRVHSGTICCSSLKHCFSPHVVFGVHGDRTEAEAAALWNARAPRWSDDMDAAPKDGTRVLTFHPANPKAVIERARRDSIVWNAMKAGQWWYSLPEQPPTRWMRVDPPKEGE